MRLVGLAAVVAVVGSHLFLAGASPAAAHRAEGQPGPTAVLRSAPRLDGKQYGIAVGDVLPWLHKRALATRLDQIAATGVTWVRLDLSWADVQPGSASTYNWSGFDHVVAAARARHLRLLPTLAYTPRWARPRGCRTEQCAPAHSGAFARFAHAAAARYSPRGIRTWEIWNEENTPGFWAPKPNAAAYDRLLVATAAAIRRVDPKAFIISGGLAATLSLHRAINPVTFLTRLSRLHANHIVNAIAYHPYTYPYLASFRAPWGTAWNKIGDTTPSLHSVLARYGTPRLPIWLTEYGAPTGGPGTRSNGSPSSISSSTDHVTLARQARIAADSVRTVARSPHIDALFWYSDRDLPGTTTNDDFYGLRTARGAAKPALHAFRHAVRSARGAASAVAVERGSDSNRYVK